jgi:HK97 gp10 family phage protein
MAGVNRSTNRFKEVRSALSRAIEAGLINVGMQIVSEAEARCPRDTGRLAGSITWATAEQHSQPTGEAKPGDGVQHDGTPNTVMAGTNVEYATHVEYGTAPHEIRPKNKKALYWKGAEHPVAVVHHPGTAAQPFLRPGFEAVRPKAQKIFKAQVDQSLAKFGVMK